MVQFIDSLYTSYSLYKQFIYHKYTVYNLNIQIIYSFCNAEECEIYAIRNKLIQNRYLNVTCVILL